VVIASGGGYEKLLIEGGDIPVPGEGEALVEILYFGVNFADVCVRMGLYPSAKVYVGWPITPGFEFSGRILRFGSNHNEVDVEYHSDRRQSTQKRTLHVGMEVFGVTRFGAYSTHVIVPVANLFAIPKKTDLIQMAGFPAVFLTAYYAMHELAHPRRNQWILVHSAAGGVGGALVQLGKIAGCKVVGIVGSSHKVETVRQLGADYVIDKSQTNWIQQVQEISPNEAEGFDAVFDANGAETLKASYDLLSSGGKLVVYGFHTMLKTAGGKPNWLKLIWSWLWTPSFDPLKMTSANKSVMAFNLSFMFPKLELFGNCMETLVEMLENGQLKQQKIRVYEGLEQVKQAHLDIESGLTIGKLVISTQRN